MQACGPNEPNYRCESTISVALSLFATVQKNAMTRHANKKKEEEAARHSNINL